MRKKEKQHSKNITVEVKQRQPRSFYWGLIAFLMLSVISLTAFGFSKFKGETESAVSHQTEKSSMNTNTQVLAYVGGRDDWKMVSLKEVKKGQEFQFNNHLCYMDESGFVRMNPEVNVKLLLEADRPFIKGNERFPEPEDIVRFVAKDHTHLRHERMGTVSPGDRFFYQGRLYEGVDRPSVGLSIKKTDIVVSRVTDVFKRETESLVDLTIVDASGKESVITGTPEHPFFVPAQNQYVAMGKLAPGTVLKSDDDSLITVKTLNLRKEKNPVYNFEVEGTHNYFVASADGGPCVLVHNTCFQDAKELAKRLGTNKNTYHKTLKPQMKKDFAKEMKKLGTTNPDFGITKTGNVIIKNPKTGKTITTDVPFDSYGVE